MTPNFQRRQPSKPSTLQPPSPTLQPLTPNPHPPLHPSTRCEASCAVSAQSCPPTHCKCDGDGAEPSLNAHAAAYATVKAQGKQLVEAAKAKRLANKNGGNQAGVDFRRLGALPPGAAVPVQGVPPMSDITAGMPGLHGENPDGDASGGGGGGGVHGAKGASSDFHKAGGGASQPTGAHGERTPGTSSVAHATRLTPVAGGGAVAGDATDGVHGVHGESLVLSPEPASGTGLHGEKLGAARTHDPNHPGTTTTTTAAAPTTAAEIGVHGEDASASASAQVAAPPADGSAAHTGSTLTIGGGGADGAAPSVFDAATLKRLAAAAAAHTKTQLAETNNNLGAGSPPPRQRLRKHGVPILGADGLPIRPEGGRGMHNNNRVGLANAAAAVAVASSSSSSSSVQEDETPGASALGATLKAGLATGGSSVSSSVSSRNFHGRNVGLAATEQTSKQPAESPAAEAAAAGAAAGAGAAPAESPAAAEAASQCVSIVATATDRWCDDNCAVNNCPPSICMCGDDAVAHRAELAAGTQGGAEVSPAPVAGGGPTWEDAHPADAGVPLAAPGTTAGGEQQAAAQQQQQEEETKSSKSSKHGGKSSSKHSSGSSSKHHSSAKHLSSAHRSALEKSAKELGEGEDLSEMSESDLRKLAKRAIAAQTDNQQQQQQQQQASQEAEAQAADPASSSVLGGAEQAEAQTETSSLAETLAKQTAAMKPSDLHEKKLTADERKLLKHEKKAAEAKLRHEANMSQKAQGPAAAAGSSTAPPEADLKLDAADEEINAWLRQQPQQWLKEQLRLAVDEHSTSGGTAAGAAQLAGLQAAAAAAGVDTTSPTFAAAAESAAPAPAAAAPVALAAAGAAASAAAAATEELVCVSLVATASDEWCSSFCAEHSCPESMCKCEGAAAAPAMA